MDSRKNNITTLLSFIIWLAVLFSYVAFATEKKEIDNPDDYYKKLPKQEAELINKIGDYKNNKHFKEIKKKIEKEKLGQVKIDKKTMEEAKKINDFIKSPEIQNKIEEYKDYIEREILHKDYSKLKKELKNSKTFKKMNNHLFIFISSSIPETTIKQYLDDAIKLNAILVLRGTIGDPSKIKPTLIYISKLICNYPYDKFIEHANELKCKPNTIDINPVLFRVFGIKEVPAIVYSKLSYQEIQNKYAYKEPINENDYYIIYGDVSLEYALKKFSEYDKSIENLQKKLKESWWEKNEKKQE